MCGLFSIGPHVHGVDSESIRVDVGPFRGGFGGSSWGRFGLDPGSIPARSGVDPSALG